MTSVDAPNKAPAVLAFDFPHLKIEDKTVRIELPLVRPGAWIRCRPANDSNPTYRNAMQMLAGKRPQIPGQPAVTDESIKLDREDDLKLYGEHIAVEWGGIYFKGNVPAQFSAENATAFFRALPSWQFDRIRLACVKPESFITSADQLPPDAATIAGN